MSAPVSMEAIAPTRMDNANAPLDGQVCSVSRPAGQDSTASTARSSAIAKTELRVITSQVFSESNQLPMEKSINC